MARDFAIGADTPDDFDALRTMLKRRLAREWPNKPDPATIGTDAAALDALIADLDVCRGIAQQLRDLASA